MPGQAGAVLEMDLEQQVARLRSLVQDCIAKHMHGSAVFYADKLVTLSGHAPGDVFLLAQVCLCVGAVRRRACAAIGAGDRGGGTAAPATQHLPYTHVRKHHNKNNKPGLLHQPPAPALDRAAQAARADGRRALPLPRR